MLTTLYIDFSDAQGQIILQAVVGSGRNFSHYKTMWIFPDAQGQLTPQGQISNSSEIVRLSSLPARMKKIQFKM